MDNQHKINVDKVRAGLKALQQQFPGIDVGVIAAEEMREGNIGDLDRGRTAVWLLTGQLLDILPTQAEVRAAEEAAEAAYHKAEKDAEIAAWVADQREWDHAHPSLPANVNPLTGDLEPGIDPLPADWARSFDSIEAARNYYGNRALTELECGFFPVAPIQAYPSC